MILPTTFAITEPALRALLERQAAAHEMRASYDDLDDALAEGVAYSVEDGVATIPIRGPLFDGSSMGFWAWLFGGTGYETIAAQVEHASIDGRVSAIVLDISSPGGSVQGLSAAVEAINACGKPVIAHARGDMCSAAYWLASAASMITADESAAIGCLGCMVTVPNRSSSWSTDFVSSLTPQKNADPQSAAGASQFQQLADDCGRTMLTQIAAYRGDADEDFAERYGAGAVLAAPTALTRGMVDALTPHPGRLARAVSGLAGQTPQELTFMAKNQKLIATMLAATTSTEGAVEAVDEMVDETAPDETEGESVDELRNKIASLEEENASLRQRIDELTADDEDAAMETAARAAGPNGMRLLTAYRSEKAARLKGERAAALKAQKGFSASALGEGKVTPAGRSALERMYAAAPDATAEYLDSLPKNCAVDLGRKGEAPRHAAGSTPVPTQAAAVEEIKALQREKGLSYDAARKNWAKDNPEAAQQLGLH